MMFKGIAYALGACLIWGFIFIVPLFMDSYDSLEVALGRYWVYGIFSSLIFLKSRLQGLCKYPLSVWLNALFLSVLSGYYFWVTMAIRYTSPEICALILGTSPIVIAFLGNWMQSEGNAKMLVVPSVLILIGLIMINVPHISITNTPIEYAVGLTCGIISLMSWSIYVVFNSRFLKHNPHVNSNDWATIIGIATFFWTVICSLCSLMLSWKEFDTERYFSWNNDTMSFYAGCAVLGLLCSWVGAFLWNKACTNLSVSLAGQLSLFETIFGVAFVYTLHQQLPPIMEFAGIALLLAAVIYGIHAFHKSQIVENASFG